MKRTSLFRLMLVTGVLVTAFATGSLLAQSSWLDKFFPRKQASATPLVEPPSGVIALQDTFANVVEAVKPAVVNIAAVQITRVEEDPHQFYYGDPNDFFYRFFGEPAPRRSRPREQRMEGTGSGVIINAEGYILTNNHVVQNADQLTVTLWNDKTYKGKVVGTDPRTDLAVIKISGAKDFTYVPLGDSDVLRVGDWVLAMGSPFGLQQTVTSGIVSAKRQSLNIEGKSFRNLIQTDAAINRGNSGGALVNMKGELIGINTAIYAPTGVFSGIGFAIPINDAKDVMKSLIEKGFVERSWMGVEVAPVDDVIAEQFRLGTTEGALINKVAAGSPAEKAGLKRGDVIVEFDGKPVTTVQTLQDTVTSTPPGRTVSVRLIRAGTSKTISMKTEKMPAPNNEEEGGRDSRPMDSSSDSTTEWLGAAFVNPSRRVVSKYGINPSEATGVVVLDVPSTSVAADAGLQEGDMVRAVNRIEVNSIADLAQVKKSVDPKKGVVLDVVRQGRSFYLSYKSLQ